jgi:selenide,water dikinase
LGLLTLGIPYTEVSLDVGKDILQGAVDKLNEAGGILMKGHTISNKQLEVGVAVTGIMHRDPICDHGCKSGDILVMTKPLGIGILVTALKLWNARMPLEGFLMDAFSVAENAMLELNSKASKAIIEVGVNACTDISGFGLIGHLIPMLQDSRLSAVLNWKSIPVLAGALDLARQLVIPGTGEQNFAFWGDFCEFAESMREEKLVLFDPQTSGGLLISVSPEKIEELITKFEMFDFKNYAVIGHIVDEEKHSVIVQDEESL